VDKRYQVFISSTYADLKGERRAVIETVIQSDCIPAGMELFPAADEEQLTFIKRVIDSGLGWPRLIRLRGTIPARTDPEPAFHPQRLLRHNWPD
jgi:hypothetical protein